MLINLTNHPLSQWSDSQKHLAEQEFGKVIDWDFPHIDPMATEQEIENLAIEYLEKIKTIAKGESVLAVHLMGELCFCFALLCLLKRENIKVVASTSQREVIDLGNGEKQVKFSFVKFREYT